MSKKPYNDIPKLHKKIEQQTNQNGFILNQFFLTQKIKSRKDKLYNLVKNAGRNTSGFFKLYFLTKTKIKTKKKTKTTKIYFLTLKHMKSNNLHEMPLVDRTGGGQNLTLSLGLDRIKSRIEELIKVQTEPILINVAGGSASGKTSKITEEIIKTYEGNIIKISMDDYYKGKTFMQEEEQKGNNLNWDQPEALNISLIKEHIQTLKKGRKIQKPTYCMKTSEPIGKENVEPSKLILLEGLFTLNQELAEESELKIFIESDTTTRLTRRVLRDMTRTGQKAEEIINYFHKIIEPMHKKYIEPTKANADIVIINNLSEQEIG